MTPEALAARHPRLFHLTAPGAIQGIVRHGLLPTSGLLDLFEVPMAARVPVEGARRPASVVLVHPVHGRAEITDNLPLHMRALAACLDHGLTPVDWLRMLNERVFFWADEAGLDRLLNARINRGRARDVLVLDTLGLVRALAERVALSTINSGSTVRRAARRGLSTFVPLLEHRSGRILEVTVVGGVTGIGEHVREVRERRP